MRPHHPLHVMLSGAVVAAVIALLTVFLTGGFDAERADARGAVPALSPQQRGEAVPRPITEPLISSDFADPDLVKVGDTYYAYATNASGRNVQVAKAAALSGPWVVLTYDGLPALGEWASIGMTWAPEVVQRQGGGYLLYYTARETRTQAQCIGVAQSASPAGPFSPVGKGPLVCPKDRGDTIDAAAFTDDDGRAYLLYRSGSGVQGRPTAIFLHPMRADGLALQGKPVRILTWNGIEPLLVEAPALVRRGGRYYLFYANGDWRDGTYRTGYATAARITGPYRRSAEPLLSTEILDGKVTGPGGADLLRDEAGEHLVFHGVLGGDPPRRGMYLADLGWVDGEPVVRGITRRYEGESGRITYGQPRADVAGASGGRALGYLDGRGSKVEFEVIAPIGGSYTVRIRYANRSITQGRHELSVVQSGATAEVAYPAGPTRGWADLVVNITMRAGRNVIRIERVAGEVDLDYIEVT